LSVSASRVLAQLNGALHNLPNPTLFLDTIYLQEAKTSSEIENIVTTNLGNPKTVGKYLTDLEKIGLLKSVKVGKEKLYLNDRLLNILENYY